MSNSPVSTVSSAPSLASLQMGQTRVARVNVAMDNVNIHQEAWHHPERPVAEGGALDLFLIPKDGAPAEQDVQVRSVAIFDAQSIGRDGTLNGHALAVQDRDLKVFDQPGEGVDKVVRFSAEPLNRYADRKLVVVTTFSVDDKQGRVWAEIRKSGEE